MDAKMSSVFSQNFPLNFYVLINKNVKELGPMIKKAEHLQNRP